MTFDDAEKEFNRRMNDLIQKCKQEREKQREEMEVEIVENEDGSFTFKCGKCSITITTEI
jgi:frataxin-like iron-binding protein CyaY